MSADGLDLPAWLDEHICVCSCACHFAARTAIRRLTARVAQLEACLTDTLQQLELGGVKE